MIVIAALSNALAFTIAPTTSSRAAVNPVSPLFMSSGPSEEGGAPGGIDPEIMQTLMSNPEIMDLLQHPKMQEAMKLMMTGGPEELEKALKSDPELLIIVENLNRMLNSDEP